MHTKTIGGCSVVIPVRLIYLGLLTDSNNTETVVAADYDDITFIIPRPTVEKNPENTE